jgi:hypothetical protein
VRHRGDLGEGPATAADGMEQGNIRHGGLAHTSTALTEGNSLPGWVGHGEQGRGRAHPSGTRRGRCLTLASPPQLYLGSTKGRVHGPREAPASAAGPAWAVAALASAGVRAPGHDG